MARREELGDTGHLRETEAARITGKVENAAYDVGNGHMLIWAARGNPEVAPLAEALPRLELEFSPAEVDWMLRRGRNLFLFPNVHLMDQSSTQIRVLIPHGPDRTEVRVYCIAPKGESREARAARMRKFEDFFMVTGMATPDDMAALEDVQRGAHGLAAPWNRIERGHHMMVQAPDKAAADIGANITSANAKWENETLFYGFYRRWAEAVGIEAGSYEP
jgi:benzoate/toluate 1,2-dioxygenase alpha subunit